MSTRWYPLYQRGNPQLRVFLPNFWLKLLKPTQERPPNCVEFACPVEMSRLDIADYLEKIYKIPVVSVRTRVALGKLARDPGMGYVTKGDDVKIAYVTLPKEVNFKFPDIHDNPNEKKPEEDNKMLDDTKKGFKQYLEKNRDRQGVPSWYSF